MSSYENIVGAPFESWVVDQLELRSKLNGEQQRDSSNINAVANNGCWIRVTSNVNVSQDPLLYTKWILQGGTLSQEGLRYGIKDNASYTHGDMGFRPMPGIESAIIESAGVAGSLRTANIKIKAWDLEQLDKIDTLYLRLGWTIFIEWGHSVYYDNQGIKQTGGPLENYNELKTEDEVLEAIYKKKEQSNGNYDAMFGVISNYTWTQNETMGYDIDLKVVGKGQVIDSLMINKPLDGKPAVKNKIPLIITNNALVNNFQPPNQFNALQSLGVNTDNLCKDAGKSVNLKLDYLRPPSSEDTLSTIKLGRPPIKVVVTKGTKVSNDKQVYYSPNMADITNPNEEFATSLRNAFNITRDIFSQDKRQSLLKETQLQEINRVLSFFNQPEIKRLEANIDTSSSPVLKYLADYILGNTIPKAPNDILLQTVSYFTASGSGATFNYGSNANCTNNTDELKIFNYPEETVNDIKFKYLSTEGKTNQTDKFLYHIKKSGGFGIDNISIIIAANQNLTDELSTNSPNQQIIYTNKKTKPSIDKIQKFINEWYSTTINSLSPEDGKLLSFEVNNDDNNSILATVIPKVTTQESIDTSSTKILSTVNSVRDNLKTSEKYKSLISILPQDDSRYNIQIFHANRTSLLPLFQNETNVATPEETPVEGDTRQYKSELEKFLIEVKNFTEGASEGLVLGSQEFLSSKFENTQGPLSQIFTPNFNGPEIFGYNSKYNHDRKPNTNLKKINIDLLSRIFKFNWEIDSVDQKHSYISLGVLLAYLNHTCLLYYNNENDKNKKSNPYVKIDFNTETNLCLASPQQISLNPKVCIVESDELLNDAFTQLAKSTFTKEQIKENVELPSNVIKNLNQLSITNSSILNEMQGSGYRDPNPYVGKIMLIYLNVDNLLQIITNLQSTNNEGSVFLRPFLEEILSQVNAALGGINRFRVSYYDEGNAVRIIDDQTLNKPQVISLEKFNSSEGAKSFTPFPIENIGKNSVVKKFTLKTEISNKMHTIIAVSAQAGNYGQITDASTFGLINTGLTDRFLENKILTDTDSENSSDQVSFLIKEVGNIYYGIENSSEKLINTQDVLTANKIYSSLINKNKSENKAIKGKDIIPLSLNLTLHGISGIVVLQSFTLPPNRMPSQYYLPGGTVPKIGWVISRQTHTISNNTWDTTLTGIMIIIPEKTISEINTPLDDIRTNYPAEILPESTWNENYLWDNGRRITDEPVKVVRIGSEKVVQKYEGAYNTLVAAAKKDKINLKLESGYRTFQDQINVRKDIGKKNGKKHSKNELLFKTPNAFSPVAAKPGYSDHQDGTAFDFVAITRDSVEFKWLVANASKYGFKNTVLTEPWHWKYVNKLA